MPISNPSELASCYSYSDSYSYSAEEGKWLWQKPRETEGELPSKVGQTVSLHRGQFAGSVRTY
jgi:hypothetical protein